MTETEIRLKGMEILTKHLGPVDVGMTDICESSSQQCELLFGNHPDALRPGADSMKAVYAEYDPLYTLFPDYSRGL